MSEKMLSYLEDDSIQESHESKERRPRRQMLRYAAAGAACFIAGATAHKAWEDHGDHMELGQKLVTEANILSQDIGGFEGRIATPEDAWVFIGDALKDIQHGVHPGIVRALQSGEMALQDIPTATQEAIAKAAGMSDDLLTLYEHAETYFDGYPDDVDGISGVAYRAQWLEHNQGTIMRVASDLESTQDVSAVEAMSTEELEQRMSEIEQELNQFS